MFISVIHGDTIDLCNEVGILKLLFLARDSLENAKRFFTHRGTYYICKIQRGEPGAANENAYEAIYPLLNNPDGELCEALKRQRIFLEKNRLKLAKTPEAKRTRSSEILGPVVSTAAQPWMKPFGKFGTGANQEVQLKRTDSRGTKLKVESGRKERHR
ncbi:uncharacterized protein CXorf65 homolog [Microcaecilia unicolor]|uniref:Uncharacterized protein CXorf65 homolog n=1 Tax=Microcaecilia unicolor TaxID=1415580 RepID=A0A6P7YR76_9AMPH|nr:uncharacterized protein CXorf65 homolog [Microcaecilia unicolor]